MHRAVMLALFALAGCKTALTEFPGKQPAKAAEPSPFAPSFPRRAFPWSVVAGGVGSAAELQKAATLDPVVRTHYASLTFSAFRTRTLAADQRAFVSYRVGSAIYWTRGPVTLHAGESILTDQETSVRGRCGNLISFYARSPVAPPELEPSESAMDEPLPVNTTTAAAFVEREDEEESAAVETLLMSSGSQRKSSFTSEFVTSHDASLTPPGYDFSKGGTSIYTSAVSRFDVDELHPPALGRLVPGTPDYIWYIVSVSVPTLPGRPGAHLAPESSPYQPTWPLVPPLFQLINGGLTRPTAPGPPPPVIGFRPPEPGGSPPPTLPPTLLPRTAGPLRSPPETPVPEPATRPLVLLSLVALIGGAVRRKRYRGLSKETKSP